ncbi:MAG: thioredoxin domain-containing protein [Oscillospiraceae bacterium]|nr:thioredoxin domain-containing protein [Oscillospiraceae bacterium]
MTQLTKDKTNRLINEKSPYLLQHAHNPVDWYAWGDEAFVEAKRQDKPIFLSIGYSTCHWCHVMEKESFEDEEIAEVLNKHFISIKVDREERPDIDAVYMNATQIMTGSGGWPLSVFLDNDKRPIYAGTYFPKKDGRYGPGFLTLLERISYLWEHDRVKLFESSNIITAELNKTDIENAVNISQDINYEKAIVKCFNQLKNNFDEEYGGFGSAPKFPAPHNLLFLLRYYHCKKDEIALEMVEKTLQCIYGGGIYDHIGFGFSRYSTDRMWLVPHFEKMLYDNALLALTYCETYHCTKNPGYAHVAEEIFEYISRDMTSREGGFYNAEDADSEGAEGKFYLFTKDEVIKLLGAKDGEKFCEKYDISEEGNFENSNILNLMRSAQGSEYDLWNFDVNDKYDENDKKEKTEEFLADCRKRLFKYRKKRVRPFKDDKITTSWNGLMICAFAYGGRILNNENYTDMAKNAAKFILENMSDENGGLYTRYRDGEARFNAVADDYAYFIWGLIELYESTFEKTYLLEAYRLNKVLIDNFWENGALYFTGRDSETLIFRPREIYDGAIPSANSVSISNFIKLSRLCDDHKLAEMAVEIIRFFGKTFENMPFGHSFAMCGLMHLEYLSREIIISCDNIIKGADGRSERSPEFTSFVSEIYANYNPFSTVAYADGEIGEDIEFYKQYENKHDKNNQDKNKSEPTVYICENSVCKQPISDINKLRDMLRN